MMNAIRKRPSFMEERTLHTSLSKRCELKFIYILEKKNEWGVTHFSSWRNLVERV
jgi:hypothetical protein